MAEKLDGLKRSAQTKILLCGGVFLAAMFGVVVLGVWLGNKLVGD